MKLAIPGFPFEMVVTLIRKPSALRWRLSMRGLLLLVMFATIFTWCGIGVFDRYAYTTITQMYYVGDVLPLNSAQLAPELPRFAELLKSSATHDIWSSRNRSITPFPISLSLIVSDSNPGTSGLRIGFASNAKSRIMIMYTRIGKENLRFPYSPARCRCRSDVICLLE
jgi:hypothetical protein